MFHFFSLLIPTLGDTAEIALAFPSFIWLQLSGPASHLAFTWYQAALKLHMAFAVYAEWIYIFLMKCFQFIFFFVLFPSTVPLSFPSPPAHSPLWFKTHTTVLLFYCKITQSTDWDTFRSPPASHLLHIWKWCAAPSNWKSICLKLCLWHLARFIKTLEMALIL